MATKSRASTKKRPTATKNTTRSPKKVRSEAAARAPLWKRAWKNIRTKTDRYLSRRPHRSFQRTRRRDYTRSLELPGYISFTYYVTKTLFKHRRLFGGLVLFYAIIGAILVGFVSQETYAQLSLLLDETGDGLFTGGWGAVGQAGLLFMSGLSGGLSTELTEAQQIYSIILLILTWLTTVWLLRAILAGNVPRLRDALYNAGAPIVGTGIVLIVMIIQLVPAALAAVIVNAASASGLFDMSALSLLVSVVAALLVLLSLYWITSTAVALVVITLPGMYPWQAIKTAGDIVIGRRIRILLRLVWMVLAALLFASVILVPLIMLERAVKHALPAIEWLPVIPVVVTAVSSMIVVWVAAYIYLLYRKVVEDDTRPA